MKKTIIILLLISIFAKFGNSQVSKADFKAIVALYKATKGDNRYNNENWDINASAADVTNEWYGLTVKNGRIDKIILEY